MTGQYLVICGVRYSITVSKYKHFILLEGDKEVWESPSLSLDKLGFNLLSDIPSSNFESIISRLYVEYKITSESALTDVYATSIVFEINRAYTRGHQAK